jgi:hypothetical protein
MSDKVTDLIATDARFTTRYKAKCVGLSVGAAHSIIRCDLKREGYVPYGYTISLQKSKKKLARVEISK